MLCAVVVKEGNGLGLRVASGTLIIRAVVLASIAVFRRVSLHGPGVWEGSRFPALTLVTQQDTVELDMWPSDMLVIFFSSDCKYCLQSVPAYQLLSQRCDLSLAFAFTDSLATAAEAWWEANEVGFSQECSPVFIGRPTAHPSQYEVIATPTHYLLGSDRRVKHRSMGLLSEVPEWLDR